MKTIFILVAFFYSSSLYAQLSFINPGFEGVALANTTPPLWDSCAFTPDTDPLPGSIATKLAYQGNTYLGLGSRTITNVHESVGQRLNCNLIKNKIHHFSLYAYHITYEGFQYGQIEFWGGHQLCAKETLLWSATVTDTFWEQLNATFIPNDNYEYISFSCSPCDTCQQVYIGVDDLSDVTVDNYNFFSTSFTDTSIVKDNCIILKASSDDSTVTYQWSSVPIGFTATGSNVTACPSANVKYVCTATYSCGYQRTDTVNVNVVPNGVTNITDEKYVLVYPSPTTNTVTIELTNATLPQEINIIDVTGRVWKQAPEESIRIKPLQNKTQLNIAVLPQGVYFVQIKTANGLAVTKIVKE